MPRAPSKATLPIDWDAIDRVLAAPSGDFATLVYAAGLDPATDLRFGDFRGVDFGDTDLTGFDFSRANLEGAKLSRARLDETKLPLGFTLGTGLAGVSRSTIEALRRAVVAEIYQMRAGNLRRHHGSSTATSWLQDLASGLAELADIAGHVINAVVAGIGDAIDTKHRHVSLLLLILQHEAFLLELFDGDSKLKAVVKRLALEARKFTEPEVPSPAASQPARYPDLHIFRDTLRDGTFGPEMVVIPAGTFMMGSPPDEEWRDDDEGPQHPVTVPRFALGRYAVTFEEYDRYCAAKGIERPKDEGWGRGRRPVINVSWEDARGFCAWLSAETGKVYRLPSEAEWEYACRAGTVTRYSWGDEISVERANYDESGRHRTVEVGSYPANAWKLFDMHGNVWEWCEDDWHDSYEGAPADGSARVEPPTARESGVRYRVVRGGSWGINARYVRAACRRRDALGYRVINLGFRCARGLE